VVIIKANSNFHHAAGEDLFGRNDERYKEYRSKWKKWPESFHAGEFPLFIDVEVTNVCNLRCPFCATTFRNDVMKKGFISFDTIKRIIDEGADNGLYGVKFNIRGEPLLHPEICKFVDYAKKKGLVDVYFNTNAMHLTEDMARNLIDAGLDRLSISFEGYTKEVYEKNRVGGSFEEVINNINGIQSLKKTLCCDWPKVRVQTVMLPEVAQSFEEYRSFWANKVDEVAYLDYKQMKDKKKGLQYPWACPQLWQRMSIFWDGTILSCNHDDDAKLSFGKIGEVSIYDSWNGEKQKKYRELHREGNAHCIDACDGCYLRDSEIAKLREKE
jgi:radical SAM protein with 4Fe4S-binding SPASM domain